MTKTAPTTLTSGFVKDALRGQTKLLSNSFEASRVIAKVSTDSRTVTADDLFVALKGESFDGHNFITKAVELGCRSILCEKYPSDAPQLGIDIYLVEDTLKSYRSLAQAWRLYLNPQVIAVAGSVGKTTTKDLLSALLMSRGAERVLYTKGSQNGFVGLPMTLLELRDTHEWAVIEVGIDAPGAMIQHIDLVRPDVAIVTAISEEHLEWLKNLETIAYEENLMLRETANAEGIAVINLDDPWIAPLKSEIKSATKIGFTMTGSASPDVLKGKLDGTRDFLNVSGLGHKDFSLSLPLPGEHNARNLLGAVAVALSLGFKPEEIQKGLAHFRPSGGRSQMEQSSSGAQVLCDFYNANPASMRAAFEVAKSKVSKNGCLWLCLADMKELGDDEEKLHRGLAKDIEALAGKVNVLLFGERMKWLSDELAKIKASAMVKSFTSQDEMASHLKAQLKSEDFVLIKGSNSMKMQKVWDSIR